jgi:deoxyribonuclease-4
MPPHQRTQARPASGKAAAPLLVGPHASIAGDLAHAFAHAARVGGSCMQIFTRNQRQWEVPPLTDEEVRRFREAWAASPIEVVMSHDSYLINLGSPVPDKLARSRAVFAEEAERCRRLGIRLLNFHPGAHLGAGREACLETIAESLNAVMARFAEADIIFTIENTAGQGTSVGHSLADLQHLLALLKAPQRAGICLDTCHLHAAGYDLVSEAGWAEFWGAFRRDIGMDKLRAFHVNDAKQPLGSRLDRHEDLGQGTMGWGVFERLVRDPHLAGIPLFLETPGGEAAWRRQIRRLRRTHAQPAG